ncbi:aminopeptidase [Pseudobacteroides cellulosolvens]|uniref:Peptidase M29 aminopeptidase II n=1 Tax=Pseudobacteroides cellulosolvens ATCC 35603 = DSM 2933 TaxID=398512 RepID=A0A0L6JS31_9FIRM|nr:aminopeptidase [Pseudobacteroides cellulosolvens]KNY28656.1 peptidase M29 aminopeptidase II [Pseudobacteroides cellulosolvens ATCC 35603 = DSM 2933]
MKDTRIIKLAENIINYSLEVKKGEKVLIETFGDGLELTRELVRETYKAGGVPYLTNKNNELIRVLLEGCDEEQIKEIASFEIERMKRMDAYVGIRSGNNVSELGQVASDKMEIYMKHYQKPLHSDERVKNTKWCVLRYPNHSMAQLANMPTEVFEDFYFNVCNLDYQKMSKAMDVLVKFMEKTDRVRITGKDTDLSFSIKGMPAIKCDGKLNIPDGEVFSAPHKDSVNGVITYNTPAVYMGVTYENIRLEFKDGKIIRATANDTERINRVFDTDEGSRYVGEFAIGLNPYIGKPMKDTLFDEKIKGSIHFTPGSCYDECNNGNKSAIHWDLVFIQRPEYGGGEIWFDDLLIRKDGIFVVDELKCLNPENLI